MFWGMYKGEKRSKNWISNWPESENFQMDPIEKCQNFEAKVENLFLLITQWKIRFETASKAQLGPNGVSHGKITFTCTSWPV